MTRGLWRNIAAALTAVLGLLTTIQTTHALTDTTFTYQGELTELGNPANGLFDLEFSLWSASVGVCGWSLPPRTWIQPTTNAFWRSLVRSALRDTGKRSPLPHEAVVCRAAMYGLVLGRVTLLRAVPKMQRTELRFYTKA